MPFLYLVRIKKTYIDIFTAEITNTSKYIIMIQNKERAISLGIQISKNDIIQLEKSCPASAWKREWRGTLQKPNNIKLWTNRRQMPNWWHGIIFCLFSYTAHSLTLPHTTFLHSPSFHSRLFPSFTLSVDHAYYKDFRIGSNLQFKCCIDSLKIRVTTKICSICYIFTTKNNNNQHVCN